MSARSESQAEASRANGSQSRGPRTEQGKKESSKNAIKHGVRADQQRLDPVRAAGARNAWSQSLAPETPAESRVVNQLADVELRLDRATAAEHADVESELKEKLSESPEVKRAEKLGRCLEATQSLASIIKDPPNQLSGYPYLVDGIGSTVELLVETERHIAGTIDGLVSFADQADRLDPSAGPEQALEELRRLEPAVTMVMASVGALHENAVKLVEKERETTRLMIEATVSPARRRFASYRGQLLRQMNALLDTYAKLQSLRPARQP